MWLNKPCSRTILQRGAHRGAPPDRTPAGNGAADRWIGAPARLGAQNTEQPYGTVKFSRSHASPRLRQSVVHQIHWAPRS